jgi:protein CpxP
MKPLIKFTVIAMVGIVTLGIMTGCAYRFAHKTPRERAEWVVKKLGEELKLSDAQASKLNALKDELLDMRGDYRKRHDETRKTIDELLSQPSLDQARVLAMVRERTQEVDDKAPKIVAAFADFYDSLAPDQQKKLHDEITERLEKRHGYWSDD